MTFFVYGYAKMNSGTTEVTLKVASLAPGQSIIWDSHPQKITVGEIQQNARGGITFHYINDAFKRLINFNDENGHSSLDGAPIHHHGQQTHIYNAADNIKDFSSILAFLRGISSASQNSQSNSNHQEEKPTNSHHRLKR